ncbi:hypothetical protein C0389_08585 [bacterium]|nr:hypothetical protein [bacterium]
MLIGFCVIAACSASIDSSKGEELYHEKCGGCHRLYSKKEFSRKRWGIEVESMSKKSKLSEDEKRMILGYLAE